MLQHIDRIQSLPKATIEQLHALQQQSYTIEQQLLGITPFPPLLETINALATSVDALIIRLEAGKIVGFLQFETTREDVVINKLVVHPNYFRQGIGSDLLETLIETKGSGSIRVETAAKNQPAVELYQKHGFHKTMKFHAPEGLELVRLMLTSTK